MTNLQFWLAMCIPTLIPSGLVLYSIIRNDANVESLRNDLRADVRILNNIAYDQVQRITKLEKP